MQTQVEWSEPKQSRGTILIELGEGRRSASFFVDSDTPTYHTTGMDVKRVECQLGILGDGRVVSWPVSVIFTFQEVR